MIICCGVPCLRKKSTHTGTIGPLDLARDRAQGQDHRVRAQDRDRIRGHDRARFQGYDRARAHPRVIPILDADSVGARKGPAVDRPLQSSVGGRHRTA